MILLIALAAVVEALAILGLVVYAIAAHRRRLSRRVVPALILLIALCDVALVAVFVTHRGEITRGTVPERP